jgi:hypothetical protein
VTWFGLFKKEVDLSDLVREAQLFLGEIRCGKSEAEAARAVGASQEQVRLWKRHPGFREALRKAKTEEPSKGFWTPQELEELAGESSAVPGAERHPWMKPEPEREVAPEPVQPQLTITQSEILARELARGEPSLLGQGWTIPPGGRR